MAVGWLKLIRFVVPAILILIFTKLLGFVSGWWTTTLPDFEKSQYLPVIVIPAVIYYITPLRRWTNAPHHTRITERLRGGLVQISGYPDQTEKYTWKKLQPLFYNLVDQDESLKQKAKLAYANGAIWTSFADSTVLSFLFFLASMLLYGLGVEDTFVAGMLFLLISSLSLAGSIVCTSRQIAIGTEQLDVIDFKYKGDVEKRLNSLDN